jgi:UDP:flavonoid glycosyltransferase YjiC (YdhE family)
MSRILLTWELGLNLGHLARLLPVAERFKADGHAVLVATRDIPAAASVLGPAGISFVPAPHLREGLPLAHRAAGYADILLSQGWNDVTILGGLTYAWLNLIRLFRPDRMILDYSPTASLAATIAGIPTVRVGNGFELPPATDPLPGFPGLAWPSNPATLAQSESVALAQGNRVLGAFKRPPVTALRDLTLGPHTLLCTLPELDHYGPRSDAHYIGLLRGHPSLARLHWPDGEGPKIFACLRKDTCQLEVMLSALCSIPARVVCVAPGLTRAQRERFRREHIRYASCPIDLDPLLDADLCITYGAEGTVLRFILAGVPQLISPWHVETFMATKRLEALGLGTALPNPSTPASAASIIQTLAFDRGMRERVCGFAKRVAMFTEDRAVAAVVEALSLGRAGPRQTGGAETTAAAVWEPRTSNL